MQFNGIVFVLFTEYQVFDVKNRCIIVKYTMFESCQRIKQIWKFSTKKKAQNLDSG